MKIAWFSPLVPAHSDVANFTKRLAGELQTHHDVRFLTATSEGFIEPGNGKLYSSPLGQTAPELLLSLNEVELPIYNLGNHPVFFSRTWFLSQLKPGIIILHDLKLHHFYEGIYRLYLDDMPGYLASMQEYYAGIGHEAGIAYWRQRISVDFMAQHFPMTEWAIRDALAVVVHTPHAVDEIRRLTRTPARMIPLPYAPQAALRPAAPAGDIDSAGRFTSERHARLILFGYLHVNRRIVAFLSALAAMAERDRFEVRLVGEVSNRPDVEAALDALGLRAHVRLDGHVTEAELEDALDQADLAINLRYPTMGEASGSQLRVWDHALPSLVTRADGYATLPPETVFFVDPDNESDDIQTHLRHFLERPADFHRVGQAGRQWLQEHHLPSMYVAQLNDLLLQTATLRSRHNQLTLADRVGLASAPWIDKAPMTARERFYATAISEMI